MILSIPRPQFFISQTKSQWSLVTGQRLSCEKIPITHSQSELGTPVILAYRDTNKRDRRAPIQSGSLIGWLARTIGFFMEELLCTH